METGKPGLASAPVHISSVAAQAEKRMDIQAPLTAVYIHTVPALPAQPYPQPPAAAREPATLHLAVPPLYSKETLPFLTLHIAGGLQSQPGLSLAAAAPAVRPKSAGKHVCPHCGRDCMKPSVLEKHLRCHTGERPYPCTTCGVSFKTQSNLYKHRRTQAHARLSSESEQSSLGSLDSMSSSRETCTSSLSLDESVSVEKEATLPAAESTSPASTTRAFSVKTQGSVTEQSELTLPGHNTKPSESDKVAKEEEKQRLENEKPPLGGSRHLPLQRQEATLFSKQWESSVSRGKSQSHESTDSGFSESSDHYMSPSSILPDHSMDSLTESTKEHVEETTRTDTPSETGQQEAKDTVREQETLEERISKLISENTAVVEDKQLENVRPRKTVLSKQGSIDLPMPYTYKDSFHFDMRINQNQNFGLHRNRRPESYSSVPTQSSSTVEHAPLTRSNSLPFSVTLLQPERSSPNSSYQNDYVTLARRGSSGQINPTGFTIKPVNQHSSTHRPLVRQTAVDCNHATDGLFRNSSVEEACTSSLSCDGDGGDICGEPSNRKFRRKKAQKFAYNKWYMYGGGTFKKLYNAEKSGDNSVIKGRKCSTNPEHEVVQGLQKRLSVVHKETITTTVSTINLTNSSVTVAHQGCPPASLPLVPAVDCNLQTSHLSSSCSSLKAPLRRNLSLSILPLPAIGSLVSHKTDGVNRTEAGRLINEEKHTDSSLQLCGAHIPSDRKKQRTDDKIIFPLEMETDPNTLTHPPPSVTGSVSKQDTNLTYIRLQKNPNHTQLQGALFPSCIINANAPSVSTSPATSILPAAKNSFLPKYQLKLPNAAEPDSNPSSRVVDKPSRTLTSPPTEQTSPSITTCETNRDSITSPVMQTCEIKKTSVFSSPRDKLVLPCTLQTTLCQSQLSQSSAPSLAVVHNRQFAATTITTSCLQDYQAGLCSTLIQSSKSAVPTQLPKSVAPAAVSYSPTPTVTTTNNQTSAQDQLYLSSNPPLSQTHLTDSSSNPGNRAPVGPNAPVVPCHVVPFDQVQPTPQNVFHVHTADLQICLQIISDEHMALIEPQIERPSGSQRSEVEATAPEGVRNKGQNFVTVENSNERSDREHQGHEKEMDKSESLPPVNPKIITSPLSLQSGKAELDLHLPKGSNPTQPAAPAEPIPPETLDMAVQPQKYGHVNTVAETQNSAGDVMSTAASPRGVKSGRSQTLEEQQAFSQNRAEEKLLPDRKVSQGGGVSQTLSSQHKLSVSSPSPSTVNQNSTKKEAPSQHKLKNQGALCNVGTANAKGETSAYKSSRLESGECVSQAVEPSVASFSINKCKTLRRLNPQASIYCGDQVESTLPVNLNSSKYPNMGSDIARNPDGSVPSVEITPRESQDVISTAQSADQSAPAASIQSSSAGFTEGATQVGREAQKEPHSRDPEGTPGQPDSTDWRPKQSQEAIKTNQQYSEEQRCGGAMGEDTNREVKTTKVPSQWGKTESNCRYSVLPHVTKPEGEDRKVRADSFQNSWQSEQHLLHLSQTHSGMSDYPPQSSSNNPSLPASSAQANLFNSSQPPLEMNHFYVPQQSWENSIVHNQQTQVQLSEKDFARTEPYLQQSQTFSDQTSTTLSVQEGNSSTAGSFCNKLTLSDHKDLSFSSDVGILSSSQVSNVCRAAAGFMGEMSKSNQNVGSPSKPFTEPEEKQDTMESPNDYTSNSSSSGRSDFANKYQSIFLTGPLHGYQPECLTGAVRPVQSCQDYTEDTSSSDDEGKLIIEL